MPERNVLEINNHSHQSSITASEQSTKLLPKRPVEPIPNRATDNLSSCVPISSEDPGLGNLSRLPREIRNIIWEEFLPKNNDEISAVQRTDSRNTQLAVLRTSRRIYREVGRQIYPTGFNPFIISVTPEYKYESWVTLSNGKKNTATWKLGSLKEASVRGFLNMGPRPAAFRVEIEAPDRDDAGQLICLFWKVQDVVEMFHQGVKCPRGVEIKFKDGEKGKWFIDSKPTTTDLDGKPCPPDYQSMLLPFLQLRNIKHPEVEIPKGISLESYDLKILRKIKKMMKRAVPFGEFKGSNEWSDSSTHTKLTEHDFRCEQAICRLNGWTAMMLRLERFVDRYSSEELVSTNLEEQMKRVLKQQQVQGEQRYLLWTIQDDTMIRRLKADYDSLVRRTIARNFYTYFIKRLREIECRDESLRNESGLPS